MHFLKRSEERFPNTQDLRLSLPLPLQRCAHAIIWLKPRWGQEGHSSDSSEKLCQRLVSFVQNNGDEVEEMALRAMAGDIYSSAFICQLVVLFASWVLCQKWQEPCFSKCSCQVFFFLEFLGSAESDLRQYCSGTILEASWREPPESQRPHEASLWVGASHTDSERVA